MKKVNIALFASGSGSNVENIALYFKNDDRINIPVVLCNNPNAGVLTRAEKLGISSFIFNKEMFKNGEVNAKLKELEVDFIVLAGFLWLMPVDIVKDFHGKIINIHPALLPKYGGKGMYGANVHKAVVENKEAESGITIHYVNEEYDKGDVIFQAKCPVKPIDTPDDVAASIHKLEYEHFPKVIEKLLFEL